MAENQEAKEPGELTDSLDGSTKSTATVSGSIAANTTSTTTVSAPAPEEKEKAASPPLQKEHQTLHVSGASQDTVNASTAKQVLQQEKVVNSSSTEENTEVAGRKLQAESPDNSDPKNFGRKYGRSEEDSVHAEEEAPHVSNPHAPYL